MPAAEVGHEGARPQLVVHTVEGRDPLGDEVGDVAGAEGPLRPTEQVLVVFVPAEATTGAERLPDLFLVF